MTKRPITFTAEAPAVMPAQPMEQPTQNGYLQSKEIAVLVPIQQAVLSGVLLFVTCLAIMLVNYWGEAWPLLVAMIGTDILWGLFMVRNHHLIMKKELATGKDINNDGKVGNIPLKFYVPKTQFSTKVGSVVCDAKKLNELANSAIAFRYRQVKKRGETAFSENKWAGKFKLFDKIEYRQLIGQLLELGVILPVSDITNDRGYAESKDTGIEFFNYVSSTQFLSDVARELQADSILTLSTKQKRK